MLNWLCSSFLFFLEEWWTLDMGCEMANNYTCHELMSQWNGFLALNWIFVVLNKIGMGPEVTFLVTFVQWISLIKLSPFVRDGYFLTDLRSQYLSYLSFATLVGLLCGGLELELLCCQIILLLITILRSFPVLFTVLIYF